MRLGGFFVWVVSLLAGVMPMLPQFRKVHLYFLLLWNYRPISLTPVLFKLFDSLVPVRLGRFMERSGVHPVTQFAYRKGSHSEVFN